MCLDMKENGRPVAIKVNKYNKTDFENAQIEARILMRIVWRDPDKYNLLKVLDSFIFRRHFLIVTEMLDMSLYNYIKKPKFKGMPRELLKRISRQILFGLKHLSEINIIHCDLKPENILFTDKTLREVKIIDFGSACTEYKNGFTYVQSRFYRSPEVMLGIPYTHAIDMWSFGCLIIEMVTGRPLFMANDERELLELMRVRIGLPPEYMLK